MLVAKNITIPNSCTKTYDFYPIEEWTNVINHCDKKIKIIFGIDWMGVRWCFDKAYYVIVM